MKKTDARQSVAINLRRLMELSPTLNTQSAVALKAQVSQKSLSNMLDPSVGSPLLSLVEKVANVFGLEAWQLLLDPESFNSRLSPEKNLEVKAETARERAILLAYRNAPEEGKQLLDFATRVPIKYTDSGTPVAKTRKAS